MPNHFFLSSSTHMSIERVRTETRFWCALTTEMLFFFFVKRAGGLQCHLLLELTRDLGWLSSFSFMCGFFTIMLPNNQSIQY